MSGKNRRVAARVDAVQPFRVVEMLERAKALQAAGRDIVHMEAGEPDFVTAEPIVEAAVDALRQGETHYSGACGLWPLREAIARYYQTDYGVEVPPQRIMVTPGASGALLLIASLLVDRDDSVLMADPGYPCNRNFMRMFEGEGVLVPVTAADNFQLTDKLVASHWRESGAGKTVAALVASPANPTGAVIDKPDLAALLAAVERRGGHLLVDEIYHGLDFEREGGGRLSTVLELTDNAFVINSFSKYFGMTGWRLGWLVAPQWACPALERLAQNIFISMSTMAQHAALQCFQPEVRATLDARRDEFQRRRNFLLPALQEMGFIIPQQPAGGLYIYADISHFLPQFGRDSREFCLAMLEQHDLAITPGSDFGRHLADRYVRFAFTTSMERLQVAVERLRAVFSTANKDG